MEKVEGGAGESYTRGKTRSARFDGSARLLRRDTKAVHAANFGGHGRGEKAKQT